MEDPNWNIPIKRRKNLGESPCLPGTARVSGVKFIILWNGWKNGWTISSVLQRDYIMKWSRTIARKTAACAASRRIRSAGAMDGVGSMEKPQLLEKLADRIMEERKRKQEDGASNDAVSAASYMEEHYMDSSLSVEMLADIAGLSPAYFSESFFHHRPCEL